MLCTVKNGALEAKNGNASQGHRSLPVCRGFRGSCQLVEKLEPGHARQWPTLRYSVSWCFVYVYRSRDWQMQWRYVRLFLGRFVVLASSILSQITNRTCHGRGGLVLFISRFNLATELFLCLCFVFRVVVWHSYFLLSKKR